MASACYSFQRMLTDENLDKVVEYSSCGEGMLRHILADRGIKVQGMRLRDSIHRVE